MSHALCCTDYYHMCKVGQDQNLTNHLVSPVFLHLASPFPTVSTKFLSSSSPVNLQTYWQQSPTRFAHIQTRSLVLLCQCINSTSAPQPVDLHTLIANNSLLNSNTALNNCICKDYGYKLNYFKTLPITQILKNLRNSLHNICTDYHMCKGYGQDKVKVPKIPDITSSLECCQSLSQCFQQNFGYGLITDNPRTYQS